MLNNILRLIGLVAVILAAGEVLLFFTKADVEDIIQHRRRDY
jgi:hypothetical protein